MSAFRQRTIDVVLSAIVVAIAAWAWWIADSIAGFRTDPLGPAAVPQLLAGGIALLAVGLAMTRIFAHRWLKPTSVGEDESFSVESGGSGSSVRLFGIVALSVAYLAAMEPAGYLLASPPYAAAILVLLGIRDPLRIAGAVLAMLVALYVVFQFGLGIPLPRGLLVG